MTREVRNENRGAGVYGAPASTHKTACPNSNNPNGHNPGCPCGWKRREQSRVLDIPMTPLEADLAVYFGTTE